VLDPKGAGDVAPRRAQEASSAAECVVPTRKRWRRPRRILLVVAAVLVVIYAVTSLAVAWVLTMGTHTASSVSASSIGPVFEDVSFPSREDRLTLRGWLFHASPSNGRSVVFVHGWQGNRVDTDSGLWKKARDVVQHGYDALLFDLRSCGTSDGTRFTLGTEEPRDVLGAYDYMLSRGYAAPRMTLLGDSMGASSVIEAAPQMAKVGALISDSAFAELRPLVDRELPKRSHLPGFLFDWGVTTSAHLAFGVNPDLRPVDVVSSLPGRAFLFVQATNDDFVPSADALELDHASRNADSRVALIPAQAHVKEYLAHPAEYMQLVYAFIDQQLTHAG
jgi:pimeloyl-ACP methyl ester carboxylesterase